MIVAHGIGSSTDLPLPLDLVLQAGSAVVVVSFLISAVWWRRSRLGHGRFRTLRIPRWVRVLVLLAAAYLTVNAFRGGERNPVAYALFVWLWVGLIPVSALLGPFWRAVNPLRELFRLLRLPPAGLRPGAGSGSWPAAGFLLLFAWFELLAPDRSVPAVVGCVICGYAVVQLTMAAMRGEEWFARGDFLEVYSTLAGRLSPLRWRPVLSGLAAAPFDPGAEADETGVDGLRGRGLAAFVAFWWGSTVFDSLSGSPVWAGFVQRAGYPVLVGTGGLLVVCGLVFFAVTRLAGRLHVTASLIPIAVGYTLAHYLSLLLVEGPHGVLLTIQQWGLAGGVSWNVVPAPAVIATAQVALILLGHATGVVVAHDATLAAADRRPPLAALADELPLVVFMIGCTWAGLFLLFVR